jgi:hypothetical protein
MCITYCMHIKFYINPPIQSKSIAKKISTKTCFVKHVKMHSNFAMHLILTFDCFLQGGLARRRRDLLSEENL